jgi:hypothetical protein
MRQALQHGALGIDPLGVAGIVAADDLVDEAAVGGKVVEVGGAAQEQRVGDCPLEMTVGPSIAPFSWAMPRLLRVGVMP